MNDSEAFARHKPVLLNEVLEWVRPAEPDGVIVDATVGLGGHSEALLERHPEARLIAIDRDPAALELARKRLERFGTRVRFVLGRHEELIEILERENVEGVSALLADLGVSSMQLDEAQRGFSFRHDAPLDMRMGDTGQTAAELLATVDLDELTRILREWGEEPMARRIAKAIVEEREIEPIETTRRLATIVRGVKKIREKIDAATLTFQALRIAVNEELVGLEDFVTNATDRLVAGGRIGVISFHSLEDRIVKRTLRKLEGECKCPPNLPVCGCGMVEIVNIMTGRPIEAGDEEIRSNPRARSAKLRVAEKIGDSDGPEGSGDR